jgi:hypothetical protein
MIGQSSKCSDMIGQPYLHLLVARVGGIQREVVRLEQPREAVIARVVALASCI